MTKVKVHFLQEDLLVEAPVDTSLADIADASGADITFGCRSGSCGTCRVRIVRGLEQCSPMTAEERDFLLGLDVSADQRLACQVMVQGDIDIEYLGIDS
jgi:ferredoxin